jgi:hypothetical protein
MEPEQSACTCPAQARAILARRRGPAKRTRRRTPARRRTATGSWSGFAIAGSVLRVKFEMEPEVAGDLSARVEDVAQEAIDAVAATYASDAEIDVDQHLRAQLSGRGIRAVSEEWLSEIAQEIRSGHPVRVGEPDGSVDGG